MNGGNGIETFTKVFILIFRWIYPWTPFVKALMTSLTNLLREQASLLRMSKLLTLFSFRSCDVRAMEWLM